MWVIDNYVDFKKKRKLCPCGAIFGPDHMFKWADEATVEKELMEPKQDVLDMKKDIGERIRSVVCVLSSSCCC